MHSEHEPDAPKPESFTGRDILYREGAVGLLDVQRAADALLRQGRKPSVAAIREQLGGGSPNTITPLLAKYWEKLGTRLGDGPESLERVPEALARVTELLWRRAIEEARERLKLLQGADEATTGVEELQEQVGKLSVALAEARAREGEHLTHLATLSAERKRLHGERSTLMALLKSCQQLLEQQTGRVAMLEQARSKELSRPKKSSVGSSTGHSRNSRNPRPRVLGGRAKATLRRGRARKPK
jgi:Plasmid replication region DNA-binding N-term